MRELATQRNFSYADLDGRADALAAYFASIGVGRGDQVTLLAHNGVSTIMYTSNAEVLKAYYRTDQITFRFDSTITHTTHSYTTPHDLINEVQLARIGGMHFRSATISGAALGSSVGRWVVSQNIQLR